MSVREYIGARYVPLFIGDWDNTTTYEPLSIVQYQGNSYTSRQFVPTGIDISNSSYWAITGNYNAQIDAYRAEVAAHDGRIDALEDGMPISDFDSTHTVKDAIDGVSALLPDTDFDSTHTVKDAIDGLANDISNLAINTIAFDTVSDMASYADAAIGDVYITAGFTTPGDLGGAIYKVTNLATANGMDVIALQNSLFAVLQASETVNIAQLGAIADDNADCSAIVNHAVDNYNIVVFNAGVYKINNAIEIDSETKIVGQWHKTYIDCYNSDCFAINSRYVTINGFIVRGNNTSSTNPNGHVCFKLPADNNAHFIHIEKCWVFLFEKGAAGDNTTAIWNCKFSFVRFSKCNYGFYFHTTASFSNLFEHVYFDACYTRVCDIIGDMGSTFIDCNFGISTLSTQALNLENCRLTFEGCNFELDEATAGNMIKITGYQLTFIGCKFNSTAAVPGTVYILDLSTQTNFGNATFINCGAIYQSGGNQILNPNNNYLKRNQITIIGSISNLTANLPTNDDVAGICYEMPYAPVTWHSTSDDASTTRSQIINMGNGVTFVDADTSKLYAVVAGQMKEISIS